jgi:spore maturation protein CgeB
MVSVPSGGLVPESNPNQSVMNMLGAPKYTVNSLLMRQRLERWKIYSLTLLSSENSDGAKVTWCSPYCLNAVHEEAGDGCVHG